MFGGAAGDAVQVEVAVGDVDEERAVDAHVGFGGDAREVDVHRLGGEQVGGDGVAAEGVEDQDVVRELAAVCSPSFWSERRASPSLMSQWAPRLRQSAM